MNLHSCCCSSPLLPLPIYYPPKHSHLCFLFPAKSKQPLPFGSLISKDFVASAKSQVSSSPDEGKLASELLDDELLGRVSAAKDAAEVLALISEKRRSGGGVVSASDCRSIILAAIDRGNAELALSVFYAMRSSFDSGTWINTHILMLSWSY